jgi:hypothetical protein
MESKEIISLVQAERNNGTLDAKILSDLKAKFSTLYAENELLGFMNTRPSAEMQKRYTKLNNALLGLIVLLMFVRLYIQGIALEIGIEKGRNTIVWSTVVFGILQLGIGIGTLVQVKRFERIAYKLIVVYGILLASDVFESLTTALTNPLPSDLFFVILLNSILWVAILVIDVLLVKFLWPHLTWRNKLRQ